LKVLRPKLFNTIAAGGFEEYIYKLCDLTAAQKPS
jgi:hypothetical protein